MKNILIAILIIVLGFIGYNYILKGKEGNLSDKQTDIIVDTQDKKNEQDKISEEQYSDGEYCFKYIKDEDGIYDKSEIKITINSSIVNGEKSGSFRNTEYSVGYNGILKGSITKDGLINAVDIITISDGGEEKQEERYEFKDGNLTELRYSYKEDFSAHILRIDETVKDNGQGQMFPIEKLYLKTSCN
jgi:hypothetical protein